MAVEKGSIKALVFTKDEAGSSGSAGALARKRAVMRVDLNGKYCARYALIGAFPA